MGRGRQKAKHTKVARELKYSVQETDYSQLERELASANRAEGSAHDDELSKWAEYYDYDEADEADDEYEDGLQQRRA